MRALARNTVQNVLRGVVASLTGLFAASLLLPAPAAAEAIPIDRISHIHDLAVDPKNPSRLYLATHNGLFRAAPAALSISTPWR